MIEEIKIDGVLYKLVETIERNTKNCNLCALDSMCDKHLGLVDLCYDLNKRNYYYKKQ